MGALRRFVREHNLLVDLLVLTALAGILRLWGVGFDLPNLYHRDEARYVSIPLSILKTGDYNPHFFNYPSVFFYLLSAVYVLYFLFMASRGRIGSLDGLTLPEQVLPNVVGRATMPSQVLVGRAMVAACGVLTVLLVYWLARRVYGRRAAWLAALLLALSPTHVRNSHFVAPDVTMILIAMASLCFSYLVLTGGKRRDYLLAGLLAGLAVSTKYNAYSILVPLLVAHFLRLGNRVLINTDLILAAAACAVGFLLGTPYALLDLPAFLNGLAFELRHYATQGDPGTEGKNAILWYTGYLIRNEGLLPLFAFGGAIRDTLARQRQTWFFLSFPLSYLLLVSSYAVKNDRTVLTILPVLAILAGAFLDRSAALVTSWASRMGQSKAVTWLLEVALVLAVLLRPAWGALQIDGRFVRDDVRTQLTRWLEAELPPGSRIVGEYYSPLLQNSKHSFRWIDYAIDQPIEWYEANADYVVFLENRYGGFFLDPSRYPTEIGAYQAMFARFTLLREFQGGALGNPVLARVYRVKA